MEKTHRKGTTITIKNLVSIYIGVIVIMVLFFAWLWKAKPAALSSIAAEEGFLENLTALLLCSSFLISVAWLVKNRRTHLGLRHFILPLFSLVAFLDEVSYGLGLLNVQPFFIFGIQIDGVHDFLIILQIQINRTPQYFRMAGAILFGISAVLVVSMTVKDIWPKPTQYQKCYLRWTGLFLVFVALISFIFLLTIPSDRKNAWLFGYSPLRVSMISAFTIGILLTGWFAKKIWRDEHWIQSVITFIDDFHSNLMKRRLITFVLLLVFISGSVAFGMTKYIVPPQARYYAYAVRLLPVILWILLASMAFLLGIFIWDKDTPQSISRFVKSFRQFLWDFPAYRFLVATIIFAVCAQLIDIDVFNFPRSPLLEEILEFLASISLVFAALCTNFQSDNSIILKSSPK